MTPVTSPTTASGADFGLFATHASDSTTGLPARDGNACTNYHRFIGQLRHFDARHSLGSSVVTA
jgi:hypothetical protein